MTTDIQFTFDPTQIYSNQLFEARALVGDIDPADPLLDDRFITSYVNEHGMVEAAARLAEHLAARFSRFATQRTGDITTNFSDLAKHYFKLAKSIRSTPSTSMTRQPSPLST